MNNHPPRSRQTFSIRTVFLAFPLVFVLLVLIPVGYLLAKSTIEDSEKRAYERLVLENERIRMHLHQISSTVEHINAVNAANIENGNLDDQSLEFLETYFLSQVREYQFISSIYFGNAEGGLANAGREPGLDEFYVIETENFTAGDFVKYAVDEHGARTSVLASVSDYDARTRIWYQLAEARGEAAWTDVYQLFTEQDMAVAASYPVYAEDGRLLGVVACDIFLNQLSEFLASRSAETTGQSLLLDRDGLLIASSDHNVLGSLAQNKTYERFDLQNIAAPDLNALYEHLLVEGVDLQQVDSTILFHYTTGKSRNFVLVSPFSTESGLDWITIIMLPEKNFLGDLMGQRRMAIYIFLLLSTLMVFLAVHVSQRIMRPLSILQKKVQQFDLNKTGDLYVETRFYEIQEFINAFNALAYRLKASISDLFSEIEDHKASKAQLLWSETLYRSVVEDAPGLLCSFLPSGELTFVNKSYAEYYNTKQARLIGTNFQALVHEDDREMVMNEIHALDKEVPSCSLTQRVYLPSGEIRHQRWVNRALFSDKGDLIGYQAFGEDIQMEYEIQQAQSALYRIWRASNYFENLEDLYPKIHEIIQEVIPAQNFMIALIDHKSNQLQPVYYAGIEDAGNAPCLVGEPSLYVLEKKMSLRADHSEFQSLAISEVAVDDENCRIPKDWLGVPLVLENQSMGVMTLQNYESEEAFSDYVQEFLEMIAPSIAAAIARRHAEQETMLYAQTNALLLNASQAISEILDLNLIYQTLYNFISEMMQCDFFMVSDYDPVEKMISCEYFVQDGSVHDVSSFPLLPLNPNGEGTQSRAIVNKESRLVNDYLEEVKTAKKALYIDDAGNLQNKEDADMNKPITRSALIVPMIFSGEVSGVIQVMSYRQNAYSNSELHIVKALSSQISVARNNVGLFGQYQSEIDMRKRAEKELQSLNTQLEERVTERTRELNERISAVERLNTGMSNILHDLQIANKRAEENARNLKDANDELEAFSYSVSHDLRAPLRHMISFSDLLFKELEDRLDEKEERYFTNIFTATEKMRNLIQDLLSLSQAGRMDFNLSQIDMTEVVESVRAELFDETEGRNIEWTIDTLPMCEADHGLIKIVWANLIGNAVKYTRLRKKATIEIGVLKPEKNELGDEYQAFFIRDNGVGFDETYIDQLFGVFQRLHQGTEFEGNGIGLATVRRIIARHGGRVWAKGNLNKGATFYFSLPVRIKLNRD